MSDNTNTNASPPVATNSTADTLPKEAQTRSFGLVTASKGWIVTDQRFVWSDIAGTKQQDIPLPAGVTPSQINKASFVDEQHGWAVLSEQETNAPNPADFGVLRTNDGGEHWQSAGLSPSSKDYIDPPSGAVYIDFVDTTNGWVQVQTQSSSAFSNGLLFRTRDGGASWESVTAPSGEPFVFLNASDGWTWNTPQATLYSTHDGGASWQPVLLPSLPKSETAAQSATLPTFYSLTEGVLPITLADTQSSILFYVTKDAGQTWMLAGQIAAPGAENGGATLLIARDAADWTVIVSDGTVYNVVNAGERVQEVSSATPLDGLDTLRVESDKSDTTAWATRAASKCEKFKEQCSTTTALLYTADGGQTWAPTHLP